MPLEEFLETLADPSAKVAVGEFAFDLLRMFGFEDFDVLLSTKPEKAVGPDEDWTHAPDSLRRALDRLDVGGGPRHQVASLLPVVEAEAEGLELLEEVVSQLVGNGVGQSLGQVVLPVGEQPPEHADRHDPQGQQK